MLLAVLGGCADNGDDKDSLPYTDTTAFETKDGFYFVQFSIFKPSMMSSASSCERLRGLSLAQSFKT